MMTDDDDNCGVVGLKMARWLQVVEAGRRKEERWRISGMDAKYDQQWCHQWWRFFMMINMRLIFLISMPFSNIYICPASFFLLFWAWLLSLAMIDKIPRLTSYSGDIMCIKHWTEIPLNSCDKERGSTRVRATGSQDVHRRMILPRILCLDARCHHIFWVSLFNLCFLYYIFCFLGSFTMSAVITLSILVATYRNATQLGGRCRSDVCPDEIFRKSMEYLFQEIHGTLIVDNPPG